MMPVEFEGSRWIGKPRNMTEEECSGIYAKRTLIPDEQILQIAKDWSKEELPPMPTTEDELIEIRNAAFVAAWKMFKPVVFFGVPTAPIVNGKFPAWLTAWRPNVDDLKAINNGGAIFVSSTSEGLVPMGLFTFDENGEINE